MLDAHVSAIQKLSAENGAIRAALSDRYEAMWLRDQLFCVLAFLEAGMREEARRHFTPILQVLRRYRHKLQAPRQSIQPNQRFAEYLHAKYALTLDELTPEWGHHQLDAIGLLLLTSARMPEMFTAQSDLDCIADVVSYMREVQYWRNPDFGMWEENYCQHSSSIGAVVSGLRSVRNMVNVDQSLIDEGQRMLKSLLPREGLERRIDLALLSLIWPHDVLERDMAREILGLVETKLAGQHGALRYLGDRYVGDDTRGPEGIKPEWPLGFLWFSICHSRVGTRSDAERFLDKGVNGGGEIPEMYVDGRAKNGPLAWAHAEAMIAYVHTQNAV